MPKQLVGIVADPRFSLHLTGPGHPEAPSRYNAIIHALEQTGLKTEHNTFSPKMANDDEILLCHTPEYIHLVKHEIENLNNTPWKDGSTCISTGDAPISPASLEISKLAIGAVLTGIDLLLQEQVYSVFCAVRPPGHHACSNKGMGFCLFNNIAIGARYAQKKYQIKRVLIVDWDVHHGNGTEEIFNDDPSIFYFSTHQANFYPGTGLAEHTGTGKGKGTTLNIPIKDTDNTRELVLQAFKNDLVKAMVTFQPELVMISAGFDAHFRDPLGGFHLIADDYALLTTIIQQIANQYAKGRIISVLEGGYDLNALAACVVAHVKQLSDY